MTVIIEVRNGVVQEVHNAESYTIIDFDIITGGQCAICLAELDEKAHCPEHGGPVRAAEEYILAHTSHGA